MPTVNKQGCFDRGVLSRQSHFYKLLEPVITEGFPTHILEAEIDYNTKYILYTEAFGTWKKPCYMKLVLVGLYCGPLLTLIPPLTRT